MKQPEKIAPPQGKLAVFLPGMGAVATTFIAGVMLARKSKALPIGSITQMGTIRLGKRTDKRTPKISEFVPLATMDDLEFCGWDPIPDNAYDAAVRAEVLESKHLDQVKEELGKVGPKPAVFYPEYVKRLHGTHVKKAATKADMVEAIREDIRSFMKEKGCARAVCVWCGSTEIYLQAGPVHQTIEAFEAGLRKNDPLISSSQIYAWACMKEGVPFANGAPNLTSISPLRTSSRSKRTRPSVGRTSRRGRPS